MIERTKVVQALPLAAQLSVFCSVSGAVDSDQIQVSELRSASPAGDATSAHGLVHHFIESDDSGNYRFYLRVAGEPGGFEAVEDYRRLRRRGD